MLLKQFETKKLHYGKYLYKLALANPFAPWFRTEFQKDGTLSSLKRKLDEYQIMYDMGKPLYREVFRSRVAISDEEFEDAVDLYCHLINQSDYKIRVERWSGITIYSNDKENLKLISDMMRISAREFWEPDPKAIDFLLSDTNIILTDKEPDLPLKVTFNYKKIDPSFAKWIEANTKLCKAGIQTINNIKSGYASGCYIFLKDERVLMMIQMIVGHNIQRVEKLVYQGNIDKYMYGSNE